MVRRPIPPSLDQGHVRTDHCSDNDSDRGLPALSKTQKGSQSQSFVRGKTRKGAPMFNAQINTIQPTQINTTVNGILGIGVRGERVERRLKRRDCAEKRSSDASLMASSSDCGCPGSSHLSGHPESWQGAHPAPAARPATAGMPAPIQARLAMLNALTS